MIQWVYLPVDLDRFGGSFFALGRDWVGGKAPRPSCGHGYLLSRLDLYFMTESISISRWAWLAFFEIHFVS